MRRSEIRDRDRHGRHPGRIPWGMALIGVAVLAVGALLTLDNLGLIDAEVYFEFWPVLLILLGITHLLQPAGARRPGTAVFWILVGAALLAYTLKLTRWDLIELWPILLVILGANLLWRAFTRATSGVAVEDANTFHATAVLGGTDRRISCADFQGGDALAVLGGCDIDLRDAGSEGGPAEVFAFAFWGGVELKVPEDWEVQAKGLAVLGGFEDKTSTGQNEGRKVLVVRGMAVMGGVEIRN